MLERNNNKYYDKICNSILEDVACIVEIDNENRTYHVSEWDECLKSVLKPEGSLRDLYRIFSQGVSRSLKINRITTISLLMKKYL